MAGPMVSASSGVMNSLIRKLATLMRGEYGKLKGVRKEVASLEDEFRSMNALLEKLADMDELDSLAKEWRDQVREMSYDIEDCIDDFMHQHHLGENDASSGVVKKIVTLLKNLMARYQIANKIQGIKARVKETDERRKRYKLDEYIPASSDVRVRVDPRVVAMYADAAGLVGIDAPRDELVELLMGEGQELKVVSIVGFGGLGKTTVANEVYRNVGGKFDCQAFVSVSQKPDIPRLLNKVLSELGGQCSRHTGDLDDFLKNIREHLQDKRYFVIIDDLWDPSAWNVIRCAFPPNNRGSRVLTTTRIKSVAVACCSNSKENIYDMRPLDEGDSRRLFFGRIFGPGEACPDLFEDVSADILKRCGGLPLAIISISSLLAGHGQSKTKWEYLRKSLGSMFNGNPTLEDMRNILDLSYKNLPPHLKTCLLYVGMYPEDCIIKRTYLVRQWIAEGFVSEIHGLDAEDVAESYFNELINRSMIHPWRSRTDYNDEVLSCRIHDIMLDLIRSKSVEENFIDVIDEPQVARGAHKKIRRVSLQYDGEEQVIPATISGSPSHVRSVVFFGRVFKTSFVEFKYVRVLHLDLLNNRAAAVLDLTGMCRLFLLRYLKIVQHFGYQCRILKLPSHIGELRELETMDLGEEGEGDSLSIPSDIVGLTRLSHLIVPKCTVLPDGIGRLTSLRTLRGFDLARNSVDNIERLRELTNMRDLRLLCRYSGPSVDSATRMDALRSSLERHSHFSNLRHLVLDGWSACPPRHIYTPLLFSLDGWSAPRHLRTLQLSAIWLSRIPKWIAQLHDLFSLRLRVREVSSKEEDGVGILAGLPSLVHLWLGINECPEERVVISGTGVAFRALKDLKFECSKPFLTFEAGAMPRLQRLMLLLHVEQSDGTCVPVGIEHLPAGLRQVTCCINSIRYFQTDKPAVVKSALRAVESALRSAFAAHHPGVNFDFEGLNLDDEPTTGSNDSN